MAFISDFKSQLGSGGARANQFLVQLQFPTGITVDSGKYLLCKSASLPGSTLGNAVANYRGRATNFAGDRTYTPWTVGMYTDNDFVLRDAFETWHNSIQRYESVSGLIKPSDYQVNMLVHQLDKNGSYLKSYQFFNAYPTSIGEIALSYDSNDAIEEFDVEFTYDYFLPTKASVDVSTLNIGNFGLNLKVSGADDVTIG